MFIIQKSDMAAGHVQKIKQMLKNKHLLEEEERRLEEIQKEKERHAQILQEEGKHSPHYEECVYRRAIIINITLLFLRILMYILSYINLAWIILLS